jgi:ATP-dependent RNA helicase RhlB
MTDHHLSEKRFSELDLPETLQSGVQDAGFEFCTPIQAETLPLALAGKDVTGQAQTGTGKSAAFLLATLNHLLRHPADPGRKPTQARALILAPTRELAIQIHKDAMVLGAHTGLRMVLVYGGTGYDSQRQELEQGVDILIGTPGRVIDYFKQGVFDLKATQVMVLDEADRMFDLGFIKDIRYLLRRMPPPDQRLNMLFSATLSLRVSELAYEHMNKPTAIDVMPENVTAEKVAQTVYYTSNDEKIPLLIGLLRHMDPHRSLVFTNTKHVAEKLCGWLEGNGFRAEVLSGDVPQNKRQRLLQEFSEGKLPVLVATDVAARGLHIPDVSHVFNFDLPQDPEDYVHRIGRTARAGASGDAISFACEDYSFSLPEIEEYIEHKIPSKPVTADLLVELEKPVRRERPQRDDRRGGRKERPGRGRGERAARSPREAPKQPGGTEDEKVEPQLSQVAETAPAEYESRQDKKPATAQKRRRGPREIPAVG